MDPKAIAKVMSRLSVAEKAVAELGTSRSLDEFNGTWYTFLTAIKNIYTALEQGAKVSPQSKQWFGSKATQRRNDPLLQYLYQARDDDEHGLNPVIKGSARGTIKVQTPGTGLVMEGTMGPGQTATFRSADGLPMIATTTLRVGLATVVGRGGTKYAPPTEHLGQPLPDKTPIGVAKAAIAYFTELSEEASTL